MQYDGKLAPPSAICDGQRNLLAFCVSLSKCLFGLRWLPEKLEVLNAERAGSLGIAGPGLMCQAERSALKLVPLGTLTGTYGENVNGAYGENALHGYLIDVLYPWFYWRPWPWA